MSKKIEAKKIEYADFAALFATRWDELIEKVRDFNEVLVAADLALPASRAELLRNFRAELLRNFSVSTAKSVVELALAFTVIDFVACGGRSLNELLHQIRCETNISEKDEDFIKKTWNELKRLEKEHATN